jgi:hypothetical protein
VAVSVEINTSARVVFSTFYGEISETDVVSVETELAGRPDFDSSFFHLIDFRGVTAANISTEFIRTFAHRRPLFDRDAKQVIVAPQTYLFGLARMLQILREARVPNIEVVRTLSEAYKFLGIEQAG